MKTVTVGKTKKLYDSSSFAVANHILGKTLLPPFWIVLEKDGEVEMKVMEESIIDGNTVYKVNIPGTKLNLWVLKTDCSKIREEKTTHNSI